MYKENIEKKLFNKLDYEYIKRIEPERANGIAGNAVEKHYEKKRGKRIYFIN